MIDAVSFSSSFNSFWNELTPTCEHFIRKLNLGELKREFLPMPKSSTKDRAYIAEFAFSLFAEHTLKLNGQSRLNDDERIIRAKEYTNKRLAAYERQGVNSVDKLEKTQFVEVTEITKRLSSFFDSTKTNILPRPRFIGCGFIDESEGDVIKNETLFEVKTVMRRFRSIDLRQLLTYAALNSESKQFKISKIGLFNPRNGLMFEQNLSSVIHEISGRSLEQFFGEIIYAISSGEISR